MSFWFFFVVGFAICLNAGYAFLQIQLLRRENPWPRRFGLALIVWVTLMTGLFLLQVLAPDAWTPFLRHWLYFPLAVQMVWNLLFIQFLFLGSILLLLFLRRFRPVKPEAASPPGITRRRFLHLVSYTAAPVAAVALGVHGTLTRHDLRVRQLAVPIVGLPPELEGFTIAHVSDLHSGIYCGPSRLRLIHHAVNDLNADLVAVTGDIINHTMAEFPAALAALRGLNSRHGIWLCEGNHDLLPGADLVRNACGKNGLPMLYHSNTVIPVENRRLILGGLPWLKHGFEHSPEIVSRLFPTRQEGDIRVLLAHHPHLFDIADSADLVLSGHTHGGQIMLDQDFGLGPAFFKYWSGLYRRDNTALVVSNGCGDWFPCRIGAPAEIGLLRLTKAA